MSKISKILGLAGVGLAGVMGGIAITLSSPETEAQLSTFDFTVEMTEKFVASDLTRYDIKVGDYTYIFYSKEQIDTWARTTDPDDSEQVINVRKAIGSELSRKNIETVISDLKSKPKTFTITKETITTQ